MCVKLFRNILLILLFFISFACSDNEDKWLLRLAENEMSVYKVPDSALIYLEEIYFPEKLSEKNYAKYLFLLTKAHYRNKISIANDTLISVAVDYYRKTNDSWYLAEASLYAGRIYEVREETEKAKGYFHEAFELAIFSKAYEQAGRCAYGLGELYMDTKDFQEALNWLEVALENFHKSEQLFHEINTFRRIGDYYVLTGQTDLALHFFTKALSITPVENDVLRSDLYKNRAIAHAKIGEYDTAIVMIKKSVDELPEKKQYPLQYSILADIYLQQMKPDSAIAYYKRALSYVKDLGDYDFLHTPGNLCDGSDEKKAELLVMIEKHRLYKTVSDSIYQKQTYESLPPPAKLHANERLLHQNKMLSKRNHRYTIIIILILIAVPFITYSVFKLLKKRKLDIMNKEKVIKKMKIEKRSYEEVIATYKISNEEFLKGYVHMVQLSISPKKNKYKNFLLEYNKILHNRDEEFNFNWLIFSDLLNSTYNRYFDRLKLVFTSLVEKEIQSIAMQKAGFELADIAELFGYSIHTVYKRNSEIRKKINLTESGNIVEFIDKKLARSGYPE